MIPKMLLLVVLAALVLSGCEGRGRTARERTQLVPIRTSLDALDLGIQSGVRQNLASDLYIRMQLDKVKVTVKNRTVILEGVLETEEQKKKAEELARLVKDVRDVINKLTVSGKQEVTGIFDN
ncbi:MAG: BON domain-containing protein [bacterium]